MYDDYRNLCFLVLAYILCISRVPNRETCKTTPFTTLNVIWQTMTESQFPILSISGINTLDTQTKNSLLKRLFVYTTRKNHYLTKQSFM